MDRLASDKFLKELETAKYETYVKNHFSKLDKDSLGTDLIEFWIRDHVNKANNEGPKLIKLLESIYGWDIGNITVLDLACGFGERAIFCKYNGINCYGIEISNDIYHGIVLQKENKIKNNLVKANAYLLPFANETFDFVFSCSVLEHIDKPVKYFQEAYRVLKNGGCFYLTFPNKMHPKDGHTFLRFVPYLSHSLAGKYVIFRRRRPKDFKWDVWFYKFKDIIKFSRKAGFVEYDLLNKFEFGDHYSKMQAGQSTFSKKTWILTQLAKPLVELIMSSNIPMHELLLRKL